MEVAIETGTVDPAQAADLVAGAKWQQPEGKQYFVAALSVDHPLLKGAKRAFFLKIEPGGRIHPHTDAASKMAFDTDLIVLSTNKQCRTFWQHENNTISMRLELGKRYRMVERNLKHWAVNDGKTDRIHLLIEYPKS